MDYSRWLRDRIVDARRAGVHESLVRARNDIWSKLLTTSLDRLGFDEGENIFNRDWDVLLVLDACRYDAMELVSDEYDFLASVQRFQSIGSGSTDWMLNTFVDEYAAELANTIYVTGNPHSEACVPDDRLYGLDEVWRYAWDNSEQNTIHADAITDRVIATHREQPDQCVIGHYMQPHAPFLTHPQIAEECNYELEPSIWKFALRGRIDPATIWDAYMDNLRFVLDDVETVLQNVDGTVAITADHGNALGEAGIYGHGGPAIPVLRLVPWVTVNATDTEEYEPTLQPRENSADVERRLRSLGYR